MNTCTKCGVEKEAGQFGRDKRHKSGLKSRCKKCCNEYSKAYAKLNPRDPDESRKRYLCRTYNVKVEWVDRQSCAICGSRKSRHVDHDHSCCPGYKSCGKCVRGVLCGSCNRGIGLFRDDPALLKRAIEYLSRS